MKKFAYVFMTSCLASVIFYCGTAYRLSGEDARAQDGTPDSTVEGGDGGVVELCVNCPEPPPSFRYRVVDVVATAEASVVVPVPHWGDQGTIVQCWQRIYHFEASKWVSGCQMDIYTEPPQFAPNIFVPALYFYPGEPKEYRVVIMEPAG